MCYCEKEMGIPMDLINCKQSTLSDESLPGLTVLQRRQHATASAKSSAVYRGPPADCKYLQNTTFQIILCVKRSDTTFKYLLCRNPSVSQKTRRGVLCTAQRNTCRLSAMCRGRVVNVQNQMFQTWHRRLWRRRCRQRAEAGAFFAHQDNERGDG